MMKLARSLTRSQLSAVIVRKGYGQRPTWRGPAEPQRRDGGVAHADVSVHGPGVQPDDSPRTVSRDVRRRIRAAIGEIQRTKRYGNMATIFALQTSSRPQETRDINLIAYARVSLATAGGGRGKHLMQTGRRATEATGVDYIR